MSLKIIIVVQIRRNGRYYEYDTPQGKKLVVEHSNDKIAHTHAGRPHPDENQFTYDFKKERYTNIYGAKEIIIFITISKGEAYRWQIDKTSFEKKLL
ncbi:HNH/endonuclease VII fold putative polymorphic toxin [Salipaludibacillus sp. LMS25]|uniref:HNH/endonuclease VII fold putative polymorphic toxin n=1 Tax=Salipaludibacillus sp. LMS25 TaxID=2924031 RepID=UPI0020D11564|nr:HNH/endonuclease VII fold putative polymorphic toxin [Salipaludibacillus sp. LMS25]UTR16771.1 HNH/endonuclease VII fold putative polymorphic toxin [Salipaludibacillus sp. LMS25]